MQLSHSAHSHQCCIQWSQLRNSVKFCAAPGNVPGNREGRNPAQVVFSHSSVVVVKLAQNPTKSSCCWRKLRFLLVKWFCSYSEMLPLLKEARARLSSRKSDLQGDPALGKRHSVPASSSQRYGAQEGAEPAQLLLSQNKDFTWKKQNLAKAPGLQKLSLKSRVRSFPF